MARRPSARWTGVIQFQNILNLDGGLYSSTIRKPRDLPFVQVHLNCKTALKIHEELDTEEEPVESEPRDGKRGKLVQTAHQTFCPSCNHAIKANEIGTAAETDLGLILVTEEERNAIKPKASKSICARIVSAEIIDSVFAAVGFGRRLYFLPKPNAVSDYYLLFNSLRQARCVAFIPEITIGRRSYVGTIRPITMHRVVFGSERRVLVFDEVADTDTIKDPSEFQLLPGDEPTFNQREVSSLARRISGQISDLDLAECVSPERRKALELIKTKIQGLK